MKTIQKDDFLTQLESVQPGLSNREFIEQSACYVFKDGKVITFNDEIACTQDCDIGIEGAVKSGALLAILRKMNETEIEIDEDKGEFIIKGSRKIVTITREADVLLPIASVEKPTKWRKLPEKVLEAIELVQHCASSDESQFVLTCIHFAPDFIEACDNVQMTRCTLDTGIENDILVRRESVKHICLLRMTEVCETETWIHFKNPKGLVLSCRRFVDDYHDLNKLLKFKGDPITLPKGLSEAADRAAVFALENAEDAKIIVDLRGGADARLQVTGIGTSGSYKERKSLAYKGADLKFMIAPKLLMDITKKFNEAEISADRFRVKGENWVYVTSLEIEEEKKTDA